MNVRMCADVQMCRCADVQMCRCADVQMCPDSYRDADVPMPARIPRSGETGDDVTMGGCDYVSLLTFDF
jgi:hypothetical protein